MRIVITGGAGFLGYHLAAFCAARGATLAILDVAPCDPAEYPPNTEFFTGDVRDRAAVERALAPGKSDTGAAPAAVGSMGSASSASSIGAVAREAHWSLV